MKKSLTAGPRRKPRPGPPSPRFKYLCGQERTKMIVANARRVFAQKGYDSATVRDICRACGIAQGTLYVHFRDKREVFRAVMFDTVDRVQSIMMRPFAPDAFKLDKNGRIDLKDFFKLRILRVLEAVMDDADTFRIFLREVSVMDDEFRKLLERINNTLLSHIEQALALAIKLKLLRDIDPRDAALMIAGTTLMFINAALPGPQTPDLDELADRIANIELFGLAAGSKEQHDH